jgi:hypothetical protein
MSPTLAVNTASAPRPCSPKFWAWVVVLCGRDARLRSTGNLKQSLLEALAGPLRGEVGLVFLTRGAAMAHFQLRIVGSRRMLPRAVRHCRGRSTRRLCGGDRLPRLSVQSSKRWSLDWRNDQATRSHRLRAPPSMRTCRDALETCCPRLLIVSVGVAIRSRREQRHDQDPDVQEQRPVVDVVEIVVDALEHLVDR